ncbi:unnamed protein product [Paramecium octaurelia]|uniref:Uncharacterized protein n=1 Tax=Paramecium octaurelia TaxID=43137 RepID=A0A8S1Y5N1_PAROT|nr:unnamed protein product [Paramecium octaurelia]
MRFLAVGIAPNFYFILFLAVFIAHRIYIQALLFLDHNTCYEILSNIQNKIPHHHTIHAFNIAHIKYLFPIHLYLETYSLTQDNECMSIFQVSVSIQVSKLCHKILPYKTDDIHLRIFHIQLTFILLSKICIQHTLYSF